MFKFSQQCHKALEQGFFGFFIATLSRALPLHPLIWDAGGVAKGLVGGIMLTDVQIRKAKPADKPKKLPDSGGLYID
ncbi:hypothetical protein EV129_113228 [Rhizobium azibense]|uniref:Uncharacterized protein n=1 Tax=Rhizobium azibense TaxID=1136135 RepID=A0A4R3RFA4_9HYPH|nr:hypothetical protein EV129_113228 [Rhizobium azibense]